MILRKLFVAVIILVLGGMRMAAVDLYLGMGSLRL